MTRLVFMLVLIVGLLTPLGVRADATAEETYASQMVVLAHVVSEAYQYSAELTGNPQYEDPVWMAQFVSIWSMMEVLQRTLDLIDVPPTFAESFGYFSESINVMADHASYCRGALIRLLASGIDTCTGYVQQANALVQLATTTMARESEALGISTGS